MLALIIINEIYGGYLLSSLDSYWIDIHQDRWQIFLGECFLASLLLVCSVSLYHIGSLEDSKKVDTGTSWAAQWWGLHTSTAKGTSLIPKLKSSMLHSMTKKKEKRMHAFIFSPHASPLWNKCSLRTGAKGLYTWWPGGQLALNKSLLNWTPRAPQSCRRHDNSLQKDAQAVEWALSNVLKPLPLEQPSPWIPSSGATDSQNLPPDLPGSPCQLLAENHRRSKLEGPLDISCQLSHCTEGKTESQRREVLKLGIVTCLS